MSLTQAPRLLRALTSEPLAIERRTFDAFVSVLRRRGIEGMSFDGAELHSELNVAMPRGKSKAGGDQAIQVIPLVGTIANRTQSMGMGAREFAASVDAAAADRRIDGILVDIDSPGGTVTGVPEAAEAVFRARSEKPVVAYAGGMMASAAYWIGAAADEIVASRSSSVGSIGVFATHEDWSQALEAEGVVVTEIAAGKYKTEGAPWKELDADAEDFLRSQVAEAYAWFTEDVARFRGDSVANVQNGYGEGRVLGTKQAQAANLVDHMGSFDEAIALLGARIASRSNNRAASSRARAVEDRKRARRG